MLLGGQFSSSGFYLFTGNRCRVLQYNGVYYTVLWYITVWLYDPQFIALYRSKLAISAPHWGHYTAVLNLFSDQTYSTFSRITLNYNHQWFQICPESENGIHHGHISDCLPYWNPFTRIFYHNYSRHCEKTADSVWTHLWIINVCYVVEHNQLCILMHSYNSHKTSLMQHSQMNSSSSPDAVLLTCAVQACDWCKWPSGNRDSHTLCEVDNEPSYRDL